jgi:hypothetical protein
MLGSRGHENKGKKESKWNRIEYLFILHLCIINAILMASYNKLQVNPPAEISIYGNGL